jgi:hypothetical protein
MIGPALQGAALLSRAGQAIPWALTAASFAPGIVQGAQQLLNRPAAPYNPGGGGMGGRRGTRGQSSAAQVGNLPAGYTQSELAAGAAAESFREGAGFPGQQATTFASVSSPIERAYEVEKSRVAQLAAQDELAKKYNVADLTKAYNAAKSPEEKEKLGLQIWATTNPQLAAKLKPGQLGYTEAVSAFQSQSPLGSFAQAAGDMQFADKLTPEAIAKGAEALQGIDPYSLKLETPLTGISFNAPSQIGVSEAFKTQTPLSGTMEAFTDPLKLFKPDLTQTQQALLKQAFEKGLK